MGGRVVSIVSGIQHSWFGISLFSITFCYGTVFFLLFSITLPVSVGVSVIAISTISIISSPSSSVISSVISGMAVVSVVPRSGIGIRGSFRLGISQSNKQKYSQEFHFCWFCPRFR